MGNLKSNRKHFEGYVSPLVSKPRLYFALFFRNLFFVIFSVSIMSPMIVGCDEKLMNTPDPDSAVVEYIRLGKASISQPNEVTLDTAIIIGFNQEMNLPSSNDFSLRTDNQDYTLSIGFGQSERELICEIVPLPEEGKTYTFEIKNTLKSKSGGSFDGKSYSFSIEIEDLEILSVTADGKALDFNRRNDNIPLSLEITISFSKPIHISELANGFIELSRSSVSLTSQYTQVDDRTISMKPSEILEDWSSYTLGIGKDVEEFQGRPFSGQEISLFTVLDSTDKFPQIGDEALLTLIQEQTFKYFWDFGHPLSGMARERNTSGDIVTTGGTGFGLMAMIVAVERGFITRDQALERWEQIVTFLESADRFHGVWPHWLNGSTGRVQPFSQQDNGADLVETAFLIQGLLTVKTYLNAEVNEELQLQNRIHTLWEAVEWSWFTRHNDDGPLYWHWSPNFEWAINLPIHGHNETQIVYILAAASPTYPITKESYINGYKRQGAYVNGNQYYNLTLPLGPQLGGPLFFSHYSYLGLDPRDLIDNGISLWQQNVNHTLINRSYCISNPQGFIGYSEDCWGLTASDNHQGYSAHSPDNDLGVITPTAAISAIPYTPDESLAAIKFFYYKLGDKIWGEYGFYDAFNPTEEWYADSYLAIDQGPIIIMIENFRSKLLWTLLMSNTEIQNGLDKLDIDFNS